MKTIPQIEQRINHLLDRFDKCRDKEIRERQIEQLGLLSHIGRIQFVLDKHERLSISDKTRERLIKAIKEYRNGQN